MLPEFTAVQPTTLPEALDLLDDGLDHGVEDVLPIAGGTNVVADLRAGKHHPRILLDLTRLAELRCIYADGDRVVIGGGTTISDLLAEPLIAQHAPALAQAAAVFANPLIRNRATVGGNRADASPAADTAPPLLALDATVELVSKRGVRLVPLAEFLVSVRKTLRQPDELIRSVSFAKKHDGATSAFYEVGLRKADAISVLSAAVAVDVDATGRCAEARIALGAVAPRPMRALAAEQAIMAERLTPESIAHAAHLAAAEIQPISDIRGSAAYRREVTEVVVRRLLTVVAAC